MQTLILHLSDGAHAGWALWEAGRKVGASAGPTPLSRLHESIPDGQDVKRRIVALVPGQQVLLTKVAVPQRQRRHVKKILPFLLEDQLAEEVALMHLATAPQSVDETMLPVAAVRRNAMQGWYDALQSEGLTPHLMLPDMLALPWEERSITLLVEGDKAWIRNGLYEGAAMEPGMVPSMLAAMLEAQPFASVNCCFSGSAPDIKPLAAIGERYPHKITFRMNPVPTALDCMGAGLARHGESALNLMQGEFPAREERAPSRLAWRRAAQVAAAWFILQLALDGGQSLYFSRQSAQLHADSASLYRQLFPQDEKIISPMEQMKRHLEQGGNGASSGFMALLGQMASRWSPQESKSLKMQTMTYRDEGHELTLSVTAEDMESLSKLVQKLDGNGLEAKITSVVNAEKNVKAKVIVRSME